MDLTVRPFALKLARRWAIASRMGPGAGPGADEFRIILVRLRDAEGVEGLGESAPSTRYAENPESVQTFLKRVDPTRLSFEDVNASMGYLDEISSDDAAAKCALNIALVDGAARRSGRSVHDFFSLKFTEGRHVTSFSIGLDAPEVVHEKVQEAAEYPILKLKLGGDSDRENLAALRAAAPTKPVRVDANEAWKTREEALRQLAWLAEDGNVQFVEQPMPANRPRADWQWLKASSPIPIMGDESYRNAADLPAIVDCFHAVNVKLVKAGGISAAEAALRVAREAGLKTMLGCMIETSVLIAAAAHLADLTDYLDLDGNLLITNDPFCGTTADKGLLSFASAPTQTGLCIGRRTSAPL